MKISKTLVAILALFATGCGGGGSNGTLSQFSGQFVAYDATFTAAHLDFSVKNSGAVVGTLIQPNGSSVGIDGYLDSFGNIHMMSVLNGTTTQWNGNYIPSFSYNGILTSGWSGNVTGDPVIKSWVATRK